MGSPHPIGAEQGVWALVADVEPELRDHFIEQDIIKPLLHLITPDTLVSQLVTSYCCHKSNHSHPDCIECPGLQLLIDAPTEIHLLYV